MTTHGPQLSTTPDAERRMVALAFCPLGPMVLAIEASRIEGVWDPISEPWRMAPEQCVDLASHFQIQLACADQNRRRMDVSVGGQYVTLIAADKVLIESTPERAHALPAIVAALGQRGVRCLLRFQTRYAYLLDLDQLFSIAMAEGG